MEYVVVRDMGACLNIHLSRPESLNALTLDMVCYLRGLLPLTKPLVFTGSGRAFCAGGDILSISIGNIPSPTFFFHEFSLFHELSCMSVPRVAVLDGICMGGGVGLSMACTARIVTDKTLWAMPETAIGFFPDVGASHFLHSLAHEELGLYLSLTGARLSGADCYYAGVTEFYIPTLEKHITQAIMHQGMDAARPHCKMPAYENSKILAELNMIKQCFDPAFDVQTICNRLSMANNQWSKKTLEMIEEACPLSIKITHEMFRRGRTMSYSEALEMELNMCEKVTAIKPENFRMAVRKKLVEKQKGRLEWKPNTLAEIGDGMLQEYFENNNLKLITQKL
jgi:enoyl-CoA hydratase/carnithine racemase